MATKLNQSDLSDLYAKKSGLPKSVSEQFVKSFFDLIADQVLEEGLVKVKGFGTFKKINVADRESVRVNTGERFVIPGRPKITFTPDEYLKSSINRPFASFESIILSTAQAEALDSFTPTVEPTPVPVPEESQAVAPVVEEPAVPAVEEPVAPAVEEPVAPAVEESDSQVIEESESVPVVEVTETPAVEETEVPAEETISEEAETASPAVEETPSTEETPVAVEVTQSRAIKFVLKLVLWILSILLAVVVLLYILWPLLTVETLAKIERILKGDPDEIPVEQVIAATPLDMSKPFLVDSLVNQTDSMAVDSLLTDTIPVSTPEVATDQTAPVQQPQVSDNQVKNEPKKETKFAMIQSDVDRSLSSIGVADTVNYIMAGTMMEHIVQEDETLTLISLHIYGTKKLWPYIAAYNKVKNPGSIHPGTKIRIPILENR